MGAGGHAARSDRDRQGGCAWDTSLKTTASVSAKVVAVLPEVKLAS